MIDLKAEIKNPKITEDDRLEFSFIFLSPTPLAGVAIKVSIPKINDILYPKPQQPENSIITTERNSNER